MKLSTKKKFRRKFAALLCISLIGIHLSQAAYASDENVYQWYTKDMSDKVNKVTKDKYHKVNELFVDPNLSELRDDFVNPDDSQDIPDLSEYFEDSDVLYELGIEDETMSAHLLATGEFTEDNGYKLAKDDWLIIYLHEKPARILLDGEEIVNVPLDPEETETEDDTNTTPTSETTEGTSNTNDSGDNGYYIGVNINVRPWIVRSNTTLTAASNVSLASAPTLSLDTESSNNIDAKEATTTEENESTTESANNTETEEAKTTTESANNTGTDEAKTTTESANNTETDEAKTTTESANNTETDEAKTTTESANNTETDEAKTTEESANNTETDEAKTTTESANNTETDEAKSTTESTNNTGINYVIFDWQGVNQGDITFSEAENGDLSISHHDVPLLADSENSNDDIGTDDEAESVYVLTIEGSWYDLVTDGIVIGIPVAGILSDEDEIAAPAEINLMNDPDETTDVEPTVTEKTHSGGGGGGSDSDDSDSTPSGTIAASTEETTAAEQTTEPVSETSEIPEKPIYPELPDISGKPDGTPDIPEGSEVEIYDLNSPVEPIYHGSYSDDIDLPAGRYEIVMLDDEGVPLASGIFTIDEEGVARGTLPKTGDSSIPFVLLAILLAGSAAGSTILIRKIWQPEE
jgi:LPXTG-motif cell wall-anchored protein